MADQDQTSPVADGAATGTEPVFSMQRIFVKDMSLEVPSAAVFTKEWQPDMEISLSTTAEQLDPVHYQVVLTVNVTAKNDGAIAFIAEVHQAGIFQLENLEAEQTGYLLGAQSPNMLFPFAREAVNDLVGKASFPQLLLAPINFEAAYLENLEQINQQEPTGNA